MPNPRALRVAAHIERSIPRETRLAPLHRMVACVTDPVDRCRITGEAGEYPLDEAAWNGVITLLAEREATP